MQLELFDKKELVNEPTPYSMLPCRPLRWDEDFCLEMSNKLYLFVMNFLKMQIDENREEITEDIYLRVANWFDASHIFDQITHDDLFDFEYSYRMGLRDALEAFCFKALEHFNIKVKEWADFHNPLQEFKVGDKVFFKRDTYFLEANSGHIIDVNRELALYYIRIVDEEAKFVSDGTGGCFEKNHVYKIPFEDIHARNKKLCMTR